MNKINWVWFIDRIKEPSTWVGIIAILSAIGLEFAPEQQDVMVAFFVKVGQTVGSGVGLINILWKRDTQTQKGLPVMGIIKKKVV